MPIDWMDFDPDSTIRDYDYTRRAMRKINRVVTSDNFRDMDSEEIYNLIVADMDMVVFKDYLKRYIFECAEMEVPSSSVTDQQFQEIIQDSFKQNQAPQSFTKTSKRFSQTVKGWLKQDSARRSTIFLLGFGLGMTDRDVSEFLTKVIREEDFVFTDPEEVIYWYCYHFELPYAYAKNYLDHYMEYPVKKTLFGKKTESSWTDIIKKTDFEKNSEQYLKDYLAELHASGRDNARNDIAYQKFMELFERDKTVAAKIKQLYEEDKENPRTISPSDIGPADFEMILCSGIPRNNAGNLQKMSDSVFARQFEQKRFSRQRIENIIKRKFPVERFDLITLMFFYYAEEVEPDWPAERFLQFLDEINAALKECHMMELYPANPYEACISLCLLSDSPLTSYSDIWEQSYRTEE